MVRPAHEERSDAMADLAHATGMPRTFPGTA